MSACEHAYYVKGWGTYQCSKAATQTVFCAGKDRQACDKHATECREKHDPQARLARALDEAAS